MEVKQTENEALENAIALHKYTVKALEKSGPEELQEAITGMKELLTFRAQCVSFGYSEVVKVCDQTAKEMRKFITKYEH